MNIRLSPSHQRWLSDQVSAGTFPSVDDAVAWAIESIIHLADDDLTWTQSYLEKGEAPLARGEGIPGDVFLDRLNRRLDALR